MTAVGTAVGDVGEGFVAAAVEPGVEEAEGGFVVGEERVVDEGEDGRADGCGAGCADEGDGGAVPDGGEALADAGDVGVGAAWLWLLGEQWGSRGVVGLT